MVSISITKIKLTIYLFIFIFAPPVIPRISIIHFLTVYSLIELVLKRRNTVKSIMRSKTFREYYLLFSLCLSYLFFRMAVSYIFAPVNLSNYLVTVYKFFMVYFEIMICCLYLITYMIKKELKFKDLLICIIHAGLIQMLFAVMMALSPDIKYKLVSLMMRNNGSDISDIVYWEYNRRYFAFSDCMVDMLGWGLGIITGLPLFLERGRNSRGYLIFVPLLAVLTVINSTTGLVIFVIMLFVAVMKAMRKVSIKKAAVCIGILFAAVLAVWLMKVFVPYSYNWTLNEVKSILHVGETGISSFKNVISADRRFLPESLFEMVFGTGHTVYGAEGFSHSDLGYVNNIWLGGLLGTLCLYGTFAWLFVKSLRVHHSFLIVAVAFAFFAFEIKGVGICYNPGMALTMLIVWSNIFLK